MRFEKSKPHHTEQNDIGKGIWNRFHERLSILKLDRITTGWRKQIAREIRGLNSTGSEWRRQRINIQVSHLGTDLERVYQAACEVWEKQGEEKTPEFVRAAFLRVMLPVIEGRKAGIWDDFERYARSAGEIVPQGDKERLEHTAADLIEDWRKRTEEEALELECGQASNARTRNVPEGERKRHRGSGLDIAAQAISLFRRARDWEPGVRKQGIRKVKERLGKKASQGRICQELDKIDIPIPERWTLDGDIRLWTKAYQNPALKNRVKKMLSSA